MHVIKHTMHSKPGYMDTVKFVRKNIVNYTIYLFMVKLTIHLTIYRVMNKDGTQNNL